MIPVSPAPEPSAFDQTVRKRGEVAIKKLVGQPVKAGGRKPGTTYAREADIPADKFPTCWTDARKADGKSALDDLMGLYAERCAYLAMHLERATGSPTVDHFVPKSKNWRLVYEWSNYRLSAGCVNAKKGVLDVVDPFTAGPGWFALNLETFEVTAGAAAPMAGLTTIAATLPLLNLRDCCLQRQAYVEDYRLGPGKGGIDLPYLESRAPFVAAELRRQGRLVRGDT